MKADDSSKNVSGFRTDYQFITKSKMRTIPKKDKEEKYYSLQQQRKSLQPSKYKGYSDFIFTLLPKTGVSEPSFSMVFPMNSLAGFSLKFLMLFFVDI